VTIPNCEPQLAQLFGALNRIRLHRLQTSAVKCKLTFCVIGIRLASEKSQLFIPSMRRFGSTRDSLPNATKFRGTGEKRLGLNLPLMARYSRDPDIFLSQPATGTKTTAQWPHFPS